MNTYWRNVAAVLAVAVLFVGVIAVAQARDSRRMQNELTARHLQSFYQAAQHVENIETSLAKGLAASSPAQVALIFTDLSTSASAAQSELTRLPLLQGTLLTTGKFLSQVSDFSAMVAKNAAAGTPPTAEHRVIIERMRDESQVINAALHKAHQDIVKGTMPWQNVRGSQEARLEPSSQRPLQGDFTPLESHFEQVPVIEYDGPFSDHLTASKTPALAGAAVTESEAARIAREFVGGERATVERRVDGPISAFTVALDNGGDDSTTGPRNWMPWRRSAAAAGGLDRTVMDVAVDGGHVVWMLRTRPVNEAQISMDAAIDRAQSFLAQRGLDDMHAGRALQTQREVTIPFIPLQDDVLLYPDQIKVSVAMDNGEIIGYEASQYIMNHSKRQLAEPKLTAAEAVDRLSPALEANEPVRLALIPTPTHQEILTWEIPASGQGEQYLVYINVETGEEEAVFRLVSVGEGELAI